MPRYHDVYRASSGKQTRRRFTAPEEIERDAEEAEFRVRLAERVVKEARLTELGAGLQAGTITFPEMIEMFRLERNL